MSFWDVLCICAILHSSPSFYKYVECALVVKPQNVAANIGETVVLNCASDGSKGNIAWSHFNPGSSHSEYIYIQNKLAPSVSSYISVSDTDYGRCNLRINASVAAAKKYICTDRTSGDEASAELIILESYTQCDYIYFNDHTEVNVTCFGKFTGNWVPTLECKQWNVADEKEELLQGYNSTAVNINMERSITWTYANKNASYHIDCSLKFQEYDRPPKTSAMNIPTCDCNIFARDQVSKVVVISTTHQGFRPNPYGVILSIFLNILLLIILVLILLFVFWNRMKKRCEVKKTSDEGIHIHGGRVSEE